MLECDMRIVVLLSLCTLSTQVHSTKYIITVGVKDCVICELEAAPPVWITLMIITRKSAANELCYMYQPIHLRCASVNFLDLHYGSERFALQHARAAAGQLIR
ncbi:hypothetical protein BD560DRAFT_424293 [Blakeslea trispora]|nr:hypothetical protein BD560DRAFT_424293 [Blakeslea trispora]